MQRVLWVLGGVGWFATIFLISLRLTFPGEAIAERLKYQVQEAFDGSYALELKDVGPWGLGLKGQGVKWYSIDSSTGAPDLLFYLEDARVRASLWTIFSEKKDISMALTLGQGHVEGDATIQLTKRGMKVPMVDLRAKGFPITDFAPLAGASLDGSGGLDLRLKLSSPEGLRKTNGDASIHGTNLTFSSFSIPDTMFQDINLTEMLGEDLVVDVFELAFDITEGKAKLTRGTLISNLFDVDIEGDINIRDDITRSALRLDVVIDLKGEGENNAMRSLLKGVLDGGGSKFSDGKYHYRLTGTVSSYRFNADRERSVRRAERAGRGEHRARRKKSKVVDDATRAERRKRREDLRKRRRKRRARREPVGGSEDDMPEDPLIDDFEDEEPLGDDEDEPFDDEAPEDGF